MTAQTDVLFPSMPQNKREANTAMSRLGRLRRQRDNLKKSADARKKRHQEAIARINRELELADSALEREQNLCFARVAMFTSRMWDKLPKPARAQRTVQLATGTLQRVDNLSAVSIADGKTSLQVINWLARNGHRDLIEQIVRVDVSALKKQESTQVLEDLIQAGLLAQKTGDTLYVKPVNYGKKISMPDPEVQEIIRNGLPVPVAG